MKYQPGDKILVLLTDEEGTVLEIMNEKMVLIDVKGVKFPIYTDQIDFPYFKMFSEKRKAEKKTVFIDNVQNEIDMFGTLQSIGQPTVPQLSSFTALMVAPRPSMP